MTEQEIGTVYAARALLFEVNDRLRYCHGNKRSVRDISNRSRALKRVLLRQEAARLEELIRAQLAALKRGQLA